MVQYGLRKRDCVEEVISEHKVYDGPARGRKQCRGCKIYVGIKVKVCNCGKEFVSGEKPVVEITEEQRDLAIYLSNLGKTPMDRVVYTPTDYPTIPLLEVTKDSVFDWADNVIDYGKENLQIYTMEALKYILGKNVGYHSEEYKKGCELLKVWKESLF